LKFIKNFNILMFNVIARSKMSLKNKMLICKQLLRPVMAYNYMGFNKNFYPKNISIIPILKPSSPHYNDPW